MPAKKHSVACVDLFCGAGGLTHGLILSGIPVVAGVDLDEECRFPFEANNGAKFLKADVSSIAPRHLNELFGSAKIRILAGCAPCQPFSTYSRRYDVVGTERWGLLYHFARLIRRTLPEIVAMENVPNVDKHAVFNDFVKALRKLGYNVSHRVVDCAAYGLPQTRRRMVLLASRLGPIEILSPTHARPRTVRSAIGRLSPIEHGGSHPRDLLHSASNLSKLNLKRIQASRPGGSWKDWPKSLIADCHRRETGRTYPGVYGRMDWDAPAPTLTTQFFGFGNGRFGHPEQDRAISLREGAILQGFPRGYAFVPPGQTVRFKVLGRLIGNAVPVKLGEVIGKSLLAHLSASTNTAFVSVPRTKASFRKHAA
jgi:DNA (cytosine-5)-methyltransferase 1